MTRIDQRHPTVRAALIATAATVAAVIVTVLCPARAQSPGECRDPQTQSAMNRCAGWDHARADAELNRVYGRVRRMARETDQELRGMDARLVGAERALIAGQRGWIAYRDGHCALAGFEARGGSMEPMLISGCKARLTRRRTDELRALLR